MDTREQRRAKVSTAKHERHRTRHEARLLVQKSDGVRNACRCKRLGSKNIAGTACTCAQLLDRAPNDRPDAVRAGRHSQLREATNGEVVAAVLKPTSEKLFWTYPEPKPHPGTACKTP